MKIQPGEAGVRLMQGLIRGTLNKPEYPEIVKRSCKYWFKEQTQIF